MQIIDTKVLDALSQAARRSPRLRKNHNLHKSELSACHRLFNAVEPGSYIRPHRHLDPEKDETLVIVRGSLGIVSFDDAGAVTRSARLCVSGDQVAADIAHGVYHTAISLVSGTVFFETKTGPYLPLSEQELAGFAPAEGSHEAASYLERLGELFR